MPQVTALKDKGLKCVVVWLTPQDQAAFMQDLRTVNYPMTVYGNDVTNADDTFSSLAGETGDGLITAALTSGLHPTPELEAFRKAYKEKFNLESSPFAETSYDSVKMFAEVLTAANSTEADAIRQQLAEKTQGFGGITGTLGFQPAGAHHHHEGSDLPRRVPMPPRRPGSSSRSSPFTVVLSGRRLGRRPASEFPAHLLQTHANLKRTDSGAPSHRPVEGLLICCNSS